jgi:hypothetical protein
VVKAIFNQIPQVKPKAEIETVGGKLTRRR